MESKLNAIDSLSDADAKVFRSVLKKLRELLGQAITDSQMDYGEGLRIHTPNVSGSYRGIWPDDFLFPMVVMPEMADVATMNATLAFISDSVLDLPCVPDRIEKDGLPVMKPGQLHTPFGHDMPLHLPAAWVRLLDVYEQMGATIPRRAEWAALIERSFARIPFANGIAYIDPQMPSVGFGFQDPCVITGLALMVSVVLHRGYLRAAALFADEAAPSTVERWRQRAEGIRDNLHRLWDDEAGAYVAGTRDCRQVDVWGNGLAYWLSDDARQRRIAAWYQAEQDRIFNRGCTRHVAEDEGWQRQVGPGRRAGEYTNGGFWPVGTGFILPAIAHRDIALARRLVRQLADHIESCGLPEWIHADGESGGAQGFLMAMAMPALAIMSILERKPLLEYF